MLLRPTGRGAISAPYGILWDTIGRVPEIHQTHVYARWFGSIRDRKARMRILARVRRLSLGNPGDVAPVGEGISELRIHYGPGYRVYYIQPSPSRIVLLVGGDKKSQQKDIGKAREVARSL